MAILAPARWNLRNDGVARATVSAIAEGEGVADLSQDLSDFAALLKNKSEAFVADQTFDAEAKAQEAQKHAIELAESTSSHRLDAQQRKAKELRDRAHTHLDRITASIREAGRYAFRDAPQIRERFASEYRRKQRRTRASAALSDDLEAPHA